MTLAAISARMTGLIGAIAGVPIMLGFALALAALVTVLFVALLYRHLG